MKWKVRIYKPGLFKNSTWEEWLNTVEAEENEYEIFQVVSESSWSPGGTESWYGVILKKKV